MIMHSGYNSGDQLSKALALACSATKEELLLCLLLCLMLFLLPATVCLLWDLYHENKFPSPKTLIFPETVSSVLQVYKANCLQCSDIQLNRGDLMFVRNWVYYLHSEET